jgi:hypothetical protein
MGHYLVQASTVYSAGYPLISGPAAECPPDYKEGQGILYGSGFTIGLPELPKHSLHQQILPQPLF